MSLASQLATDLQSPQVANGHKAPRVRKATASKSAKEPKVTKKYSFYLSPEQVKRLSVAATMSDKSSSELLGEIIAESPSLKRWVVSDRSSKSGGQGDPSSSVRSDDQE
jgi:hypothetical protein